MLQFVSDTAGKDQFNLMLPKDVIKRLERLATTYNKGKRTIVAAEVIEEFLDDWEMMQKRVRELREEQRQRRLGQPAQDSPAPSGTGPHSEALEGLSPGLSGEVADFAIDENEESEEKPIEKKRKHK